MTVVDDRCQARLDRLQRVVPLPLLAVSAVVSIIVSGSAPTAREATVIAAAAAWSLVAGVRPRSPVPWRVTAFAGHSALAAVLVGIDPAFGIYACSGFIFAYPLGKTGRVAGSALTALIVSASLSGGYPTGLTGHSLVYLLVAAVTLALVVNSASVTNHALRQHEERDRITVENARLREQLQLRARDAGIIEEGRRLAAEVQDTLAQSLTGIITQLAAAEQARDDPEALSRHLELARSLATAGLTEARRSVRALRPEQLDSASLPVAIGTLTREWAEQSGVPARLNTTGTHTRLAGEVEDTVFRVAQEALSNVAKHAQAGRVALTLTYLDDTLLLDVHDDGHGFDPDTPTDGYGLAGMRERLAGVGGMLTIESADGHGTTLNVAVPLR